MLAEDSRVTRSWAPVALAVLALAACKKDEAPKPAAAKKAVAAVEKAPTKAAAQPAARAAAGSAAAMRAEGVVPEPEQAPCKNCTVDLAGRVEGSFQPVESCGATGDPVVYPLKAPRVEVLSGPQQGSEFELKEVPESFDEGSNLEGKLPDGAKPAEWVEARILVEDSAGHTCTSMLKVLK